MKRPSRLQYREAEFEERAAESAAQSVVHSQQALPLEFEPQREEFLRSTSSTLNSDGDDDDDIIENSAEDLKRLLVLEDDIMHLVEPSDTTYSVIRQWMVKFNEKVMQLRVHGLIFVPGCQNTRRTRH